jgi:hypothetical protein
MTDDCPRTSCPYIDEKLQELEKVCDLKVSAHDITVASMSREILLRLEASDKERNRDRLDVERRTHDTAVTLDERLHRMNRLQEKLDSQNEMIMKNMLERTVYESKHDSLVFRVEILEKTEERQAGRTSRGVQLSIIALAVSAVFGIVDLIVRLSFKP